MENITNFYETAPLMLANYWSVAALSSILFLVQAIILLIGFDTDSDFSGGDAAFDADGMNLVSFKTILCFLLGFGWTGAIFYPIFENKLTVALIAVAAGVSFMFLIAFLLRQVLRLSSEGTFSTANIVGLVGSVYLRIPGPEEAGKANSSPSATPPSRREPPSGWYAPSTPPPSSSKSSDAGVSQIQRIQ